MEPRKNHKNLKICHTAIKMAKTGLGKMIGFLASQVNILMETSIKKNEQHSIVSYYLIYISNISSSTTNSERSEKNCDYNMI